MARVVGDVEKLVKGVVAPAFEFQPEQRRLGNAGDAVGAAGQLGHVVEQNPDDLAKAQGDDGQIITPQPQHRKAEQKAEQRRHAARNQQAGPEIQPQVGIEQRIAVSAHRIKGDVTQIQQPGQPHHHVQPQPQHHVNQGQGRQIHGTARAHEGPDQQGGQHQHGHDAIQPGPFFRHRQGKMALAVRQVLEGTAQLPLKQLGEKHQGGAQRQPFPGLIQAVGDNQPGAGGFEPKAEQPAGQQQKQHGGNQGGFELVHTFSTSGLPRMPVGMNSSTAISNPKDTTSLYSVLK